MDAAGLQQYAEETSKKKRKERKKNEEANGSNMQDWIFESRCKHTVVQR